MDLVDVDGVFKMVMFRLILVPRFVIPLILVVVVDDGSVVGTSLGMERERVGFENLLKPRRLYTELVDCCFAEVRDPGFPDAALGDLIHVVCLLIPAVEVADYGDCQRVGSPDAEHGSLNAVTPVVVSAQEIIHSYGVAAVEQVERKSLIV